MFFRQRSKSAAFEIITEELEQEGIVLPEIQAPITKRCIHTSADFDYAKNLVYSEHAVEKKHLKRSEAVLPL